MFAIKTNIPQIRNKLKRIQALVKNKPGWKNDVRGVFEDVRDYVAEKTPKGGGSQKGGQHLADGWTLRTIGGSAKGRIPLLGFVYNKFTHKLKPPGAPRAGALLASKRDRATHDYTLLECLEWGTRPHDIVPVDAEVLRFEASDGEDVFTRHVDHPGTRAYGMVRKARKYARRRLRKLGKVWRRRVRREWKRG